MDLLRQLLPLLKIFLVFTGMLAGIRFKIGLATSIALGSVALVPLFGHSLLDWPGIAANALTDPKTLYLAAIVTLILVLSDLLDKSGQTAALMRAMAPRLKSPRLRLAFFPALIGLLPMPGGAVFSAPMVKSVAEDLEIHPEDKALVNYWFRHVWETSWPLYPGVILAASLTNIPIAILMAYNLPIVAITVFLGWMFFLRPKALRLTAPPAAPDDAPVANLGQTLRLGLPLFTATAGALVFETILNAIWPGAPMELGISGALALAAFICATQNRLNARQILISFANKHILNMLAVIAAIFIFKDTLQATNVVNQLAKLAGGDAALAVAAILLPLLVGLISGISMAFVGATFPLLLDLLHVLNITGSHATAWIILAYISGFTGIMASPLHICFIFSCQFFNVNLSHAWRRLALPCSAIFASGVALFFIYR